MGKKGTNQIAIAMALMSVAEMHNKKPHAFGLNGNVYPINNKKGFAARDKRRKK